MGKFIYALNEEDRDTLLAKGYKELFKSSLNGNTVYAFDNSLNKIYATFSNEDKKKYLVSNVATFV